jgi:cell division cycle protein 37
MSKGFNYKKWDNIELSDDESDCHPNIEKESWFRMKHRARVEREEKEDNEKKGLNASISANAIRITQLKSQLAKLTKIEEAGEESLEGT